MKCPFCGTPDSRVIDTRPQDDGEKIRRRRLCEKCGMRFTTIETTERSTVWVVKKSGAREAFDPQKVLSSMVRACKKQTIPLEELENVVRGLETMIYSSPKHEIASVEIGEYILEKLRDLDEVAYIRFASVYRDFSDIESFSREIKMMKKQNK
ncbi:MAG TPA: transcriptional regulator NrdR [Oscillospiraceae bacterium]|nr:transcriptional regulator NrdR [Oscillospiraceae bacterium]HPF56117.1 transcriptional regulator NrdR [Clostridiales bacterium]HPK34349.1 transcriptional regulator NrdR [Oscillospiraceae bacterium]HPR75128.1 transcriptional regulator NrdR [Oscillospiraceae bacterium]